MRREYLLTLCRIRGSAKNDVFIFHISLQKKLTYSVTARSPGKKKFMRHEKKTSIPEKQVF